MPLALGVLFHLTARKTSFINDSKGAVRKRGWNRAPAPSHNRTHFNMRSSNVSIKGYRNWSYYFFLSDEVLYHLGPRWLNIKVAKNMETLSTCPPSRRPSEWPFYDMENKCFHPASEINVRFELSLFSVYPGLRKFSTSSRREWRTRILWTAGNAERDHLAVTKPHCPARVASVCSGSRRMEVRVMESRGPQPMGHSCLQHGHSPSLPQWATRQPAWTWKHSTSQM